VTLLALHGYQLALAITIALLVYVVFIVLLLGLFKAASLGDRQQERALRTPLRAVRDSEWPWPPKRKDAA
jgi:hypothetical protein